MSKKQQSNRQKSAISAQGIRRDADLPWGDMTDVLVEKGDIPAPRRQKPAQVKKTEQKPAKFQYDGKKPVYKKQEKPVRTAKPEPEIDPRWAALKAIKNPEPKPELIAEVAQAIMEMPEFAVIEQATALEAEAAAHQGEVKRILGDDDLKGTILRIRDLQERVITYKAGIKNGALKQQGITEKRAMLWGIQKFGDVLEAAAEAVMAKDSAAQQMRIELSELMVKAEEAQKYQERADSLLKEAGKLLASIK